VDRSLWRLTVAGGLDFDPAHTAEIRQRIQQLGLAGSVRLIGPCDDETLIELLSASHIFCMPYAYEGFGIAMLEAMAFGLPAIGSRAGAAAETISHGDNGFLLAPDDLAGLEPLLVHLQHDREALFRLSLAARATYAACPGWQDSIAAIHGFLQSMPGGPDRGEIVELSRSAATAAPRDASATK
jgi:glycosyltransferase involved in cell wall biosynthesis